MLFQNIINNSANKRLEIEQRYAEEIEEIEESLGETKQTLQEQADDELFLHFVMLMHFAQKFLFAPLL